MIEELAAQTDQTALNLNDKGLPPDTSISAQYKKPNDQIFGRFARNRLLGQLIIQSVNKQQYDVAYEVIKRFIGDLLKARDLNFFDMFFEQFKDTKYYEAKIELILVSLPLMSKKQALKLLKILRGAQLEPL